MAMHGSNVVGCATSMAAAAKLAATASAAHVPSVLAPGADGTARRPACPDAFERPAPGATAHECSRTPVLGGGATPAAMTRPAVAPDPALAALAGMLGSATPPPRAESVLQQLTAQLSTMLAAISSRLGALRPELPELPGAGLPRAADDAGGEQPRVDPSLLQVRQPPPPPIGPVLTLDPATGMIVDPLDGGDGVLDDAQATTPSSWVPVTTGVFGRVRRRIGSLVDRIDALLAEVGMTRLQLLLLMLLGPAAVAFAIDVVVQLLAER